jgi:hypothetical protein
MGVEGSEAPRGVGGWLQRQVEKFDTVHVTVFGIAMYVLVHFSYSIFYGQFGVSPTEVGLTYVEVLTRSAPPMLVLMGLFLLLANALGKPLLRQSSTARARYPVVALVVFVLTVLLAGPVRAHRLAYLVEGGSPVRSRWFGEVVDVRVDYVTVLASKQASAKPTAPGSAQSTSPPDPATGLEPGLDLSAPEADIAVRSGSTLEVAKRRTLLYLGQANGVAVLFDPLQRQTIRIPVSEVTIFSG